MKTRYTMSLLKIIVPILLVITTVFSGHIDSDAAVKSVSDRTPQVRDAIVAAVPDITDAADVTETHLASITSLSMYNRDITALKVGDFDGLTSLQNLLLLNNQLQTLPKGIFDQLTALRVLYLNNNDLEILPKNVFAKLKLLRTLRLDKNELSVLPKGVFTGLLSLQRLYLFENNNDFLFPVTLEQVNENSFKVVVPSGAPFDIVVPISITNGSIANGVTQITIPTGTVESQPFTVVPMSGRTTVVALGTLPTLPFLHNGYALINATALSEQVRSSINANPEFTEGEMTTRDVDENTGSGVNIGTAVSATDADNDTLIYSLGGTDASAFSIDTTTGQLRTNAALDYETNSVYMIMVKVTDNITGSDTIAVTINVNDVNELPDNTDPVFTEGGTATRAVDENTGSGVDIGSAVAATDADPDDTLTYSLGGTDASSFSIDSTDGQLSTSTSLDYEMKSSYSVTVNVSDGNGGTDSISVTIDISDVNEAPVFADGVSTTRSIPENTDTGINIGSAISASDDDGDTLTYTLGGDDASSFSIESTTGQLKTSADLDYETKTSYSVTITVSDDTLTDSITVTISVVNLDETPSNNAPVFTDGTSTTRTVAENTASGQNIGTPIAATDVDQNKLAWTLSGKDASAFSIDVNTGQLKTSASLNHETKSTYSVTVTVSDGGASDTIAVTISVTDVNEAPVLTAGTSISLNVAENTASNTNIGTTFTATDEDNDSLTWTLGGTDAAAFDIVSTTGQLQTKAALDYETKKVYSVTVTVSDDELTDTITVTINVTDVDENRAPVFTDGASATRSIAENTGSGVNIGSAVSATDPDNNTITYTLGGTNAALFSIDSSSGQLRTKAALNYETKSSYTVTVTASDDNLTDTISVTISVTDANDAPVLATGTPRSLSVAENTATGQNIGTAFTASDEDNDSLTYSLGGINAAAFTIGLTTGQLQTKDALDYETKSSYSVTISVSDGEGGTTSISVTINVTDVAENRAPVFTDGSSTTRSIPENTAAGQNIGSAVAATDQDSGDVLTYTLGGNDAESFSIVNTSGQLQTKNPLDYETDNSYSVTISVSDDNGGSDSITVTISVTDVNENRAPVFADSSFSYRIAVPAANDNIGDAVTAIDTDEDDLTYTLGGDDASFFSIVSNTGQLKAAATLVSDKRTSYTIKVIASDGNGGTAEISGTIRINRISQGVINSAPTFTDGDSTTRSVAENTAAGNNIGTAVAATDTNTADTLTYTLGGTDDTSFDIVSTTGQLQTKTALDFETKSSYSVTVSVSDGKGGTDSIDVTITITDVNEAPTFTDGSTATRSVAENTAANTDIGTAIAATDPDSDTLTYSLGGDDASSFDIVSTTGQLQTEAELDYETKTTYSVVVSVSDGTGAGTFTVTIPVTINVTDVEDEETDTNTAFVELIDRTREVQQAIKVALGRPTIASEDVTAEMCATVTSLNLSVTSLNLGGRILGPPSFQRDDFNGLSALKTIDMRYNKDLTSLPSGLFDELSALERLDLNQTSIASLPSGIFDDLTSLKYLDLGWCEFTSLPDGIFDELSALQTLKMDPVNMTTLDSDIFEGLTSLKYLDLARLFTSLPADIFENNTALETLLLNGNKFGTLPAGSFDGLSSLKTLRLDRCGLTALPPGIFDDLTALEELQLWDNDLTALPPDIFANTSSLIYLTLKYNRLESLLDGIFDNTTALTSLNLADNSLTSLRTDVFSGLSALQSLYLDKNSLTSLPNDVFDGLSALEWLNVENNGISDFSGLNFRSLTSDFSAFRVAGCPGVSNPDQFYQLIISYPHLAGTIEGLGDPPPYFKEGATATRSVAENTAANTNIGDPITAIHMSPSVHFRRSSLTYAFPTTTGDHDSFDIDENTGQLKTKTTLDYEVKSSYSVTVVATLGITYPYQNRAVAKTDTIVVTINVTDVSDAPSTAVATPSTTALQANYPNPSNPETWIPYQLATSADVSISIYSADGQLVRTLTLGHQDAGYYRSQNRAAHWDGKNDVGEKVASGVYFYKFTAGDYTATRKMLIRK